VRNAPGGLGQSRGAHACRVRPTLLDAQEALGARTTSTWRSSRPWAVEAFHQAYPPTAAGVLATGFWEMSDSAG
jgi:hypothetical protein